MPDEFNIFSNRKYNTELHINAYNERYIAVHPNDIENNGIKEFDKDFPCHIYSVCLFPRMIADPKKSWIIDDLVNIGGTMINGDDRVPFTLRIPKRKFLVAPTELLDIQFSSGNARYSIVNQKGEEQFWGVVSMLALNSSQFIHERKARELLRNFEIAYIGKAYGKDGKRTAAIRLKSHEKLQKILSELTIDTSKEPILLLMNYEYQMNLSFGPKKDIKGVSKKDEALHESTITNAILNKELLPAMTSYTEAGLINYFKPKYNTIEFVDFPTLKHESYKRLLELEPLTLSIVYETGSDEFPIKTGTLSTTNKDIHFLGYNLRNTRVTNHELHLSHPEKMLEQ